MIIRYLDGNEAEAVLVARSGNRMRVAMRGSDDFVEFAERNGMWISEDCEPARIEFEWQRAVRAERVTEADCICSPELAAHLTRLLFAGEEQQLRLAAEVHTEFPAIQGC